MNFSFLEEPHQTWRDILVIGKTIERDNQNYHIVGMTLSDIAKLYIIEPYIEVQKAAKKGIRNQRRLLKEHDTTDCCYLNCRELYLGSRKLLVQGGTGGSLKYCSEDYGTIQLFLDMMSAGWHVPQWLKNEDWDNLQLITLNISNIKRLPKYSPEMPIIIKHSPNATQHILEKTVTLTVGKSCAFDFTDDYGDTVQCYINNVTLIDTWKDVEKQFHNSKLIKRLSPERLKELKKHSYDALKQNCPEGMCYIGVEYECSKDFRLNFYSKQFLKSLPKTHSGSASFLLMLLKPDAKTGTHNLPLHGDVIATPVSPDTKKIPAELFRYQEIKKEWGCRTK